MNKQDRRHPDTASEPIWLYLLAGYVIGFAAAHLLAQRTLIGNRTGALLGGFSLALSGRSLGNPWRTTHDNRAQ